MRIRKKSLPKKFQDDEEEKISELFERAERGDTESMMRMLMKSGRGYEMNEDDFNEILKNRQEGT